MTTNPKREITMLTTKQFAAIQPKEGDSCVHCGHLYRDTAHHFWMITMTFVRPEGTVGDAKWLICCDPCFQQAKGDPRKVLIRGDSTWIGDEPAVMTAVNPFKLAPGAKPPQTV
jgi:hypothetical protein